MPANKFPTDWSTNDTSSYHLKVLGPLPREDKHVATT
jgi:hypothetical protein